MNNNMESKFEIIMKDKSNCISRGAFSLCYFDKDYNYDQIIDSLTIEEQGYFKTLKFKARIKSYLQGRFAAKKALSTFFYGENTNNLSTFNGFLNQPILSTQENIQISLSHSHSLGGALVFPEAIPMGLDIEFMSDENASIFETQLTSGEKKLINYHNDKDYKKTLMIIWTAKEALSKILRTGLTVPLEVLEVKNIKYVEQNEFKCDFTNFGVFTTHSFVFEDYICSLAYPAQLSLVQQKFKVEEDVLLK
ncbi:4'-phosphopantetheinyl transferase family protein [Fictibacillus phosphorivorans]|uniref:4'-phosphopantetheinyl transferase family protein n=1 Tax=Fictibacillus phosphorivorans TaxID=1221500 RepID=UPI003CE8E78A